MEKRECKRYRLDLVHANQHNRRLRMDRKHPALLNIPFLEEA